METNLDLGTVRREYMTMLSMKNQIFDHMNRVDQHMFKVMSMKNHFDGVKYVDPGLENVVKVNFGIEGPGLEGILKSISEFLKRAWELANKLFNDFIKWIKGFFTKSEEKAETEAKKTGSDIADNCRKMAKSLPYEEQKRVNDKIDSVEGDVKRSKDASEATDGVSRMVTVEDELRQQLSSLSAKHVHEYSAASKRVFFSLGNVDKVDDLKDILAFSEDLLRYIRKERRENATALDKLLKAYDACKSPDNVENFVDKLSILMDINQRTSVIEPPKKAPYSHGEGEISFSPNGSDLYHYNTFNVKETPDVDLTILTFKEVSYIRDEGVRIFKEIIGECNELLKGNYADISDTLEKFGRDGGVKRNQIINDVKGINYNFSVFGNICAREMTYLSSVRTWAETALLAVTIYPSI